MAPTTTGLMATLVGFGTTGRNVNPDLAGRVRAGLDGHGALRRTGWAAKGKARLRGAEGRASPAAGIAVRPGSVGPAGHPGGPAPEAGLAACGVIRRPGTRMTA